MVSDISLAYNGDIQELETALRARALTEDERIFLEDNLKLARLRKMRADVRQKEISNDLRAKTMMPREMVLTAWDEIAACLKQFSSALRRDYGNDAVDLWNDHLATAEEVVTKRLSGSVARSGDSRVDASDPANREALLT